MPWRLFLLSLLSLSLGVRQLEAQTNPSIAAIRVACAGASITAGFGTKNHATESYPAQMQSLLGTNYEVRNFGVSGATMLKEGNRPYWQTPAYQKAHDFKPNIVVIDLGGNDSKATNWTHKTDFAADTRAMIESFRTLPGPPRILLCLPMPCFNPPSSGINDDIIKEQIPLMQKVAFEASVEIVDLHTAFADKKDWFTDGVHPNADGARSMAEIIGRAILHAVKPSPTP